METSKFMVVERGGTASQVETEIHGQIMEVVSSFQKLGTSSNKDVKISEGD